MKDELAERLLAQIMKWNAPDVASERPDLQALALQKYNGYEQFSAGMRFIESLALWLEQFKTDSERLGAYSLVKSRLIYISNAEMSHLVSIAYPDIIRHTMVKVVANQVRLPYWKVKKIEASKEFKLLLRQSLFLGLSDGSHIDVFRRTNQQISTEQIFRAHELTDERAADMLKALKEDGERILGRPLTEPETHFRMVFLLDDFSGSGISYIRREGERDAGKVAKFQQSITSNSGGISKIVDITDVNVSLVLYVATARARDSLLGRGGELFGSIPFSVSVVQLLPDSIGHDVRQDAEFGRMMKEYYDPRIETDSYKKGKCAEPYLGFDECALPLILNHNTPNNTVPLLWFPENMRFRGLFPRVSRFSE